MAGDKKSKKSKKSEKSPKSSNVQENISSLIYRLRTKLDFHLKGLNVKKVKNFFLVYQNIFITILFLAVIYKYVKYKNKYHGHLNQMSKHGANHRYHLGDASAFEAAQNDEESIDLATLEHSLGLDTIETLDHVSALESDSNKNWIAGQEALLYKMKHPVPTKSPEEIIHEEELKGIRHPNMYGRPENINFVFHNKLPKAGSSTMNILLDTLATQNKFHWL